MFTKQETARWIEYLNETNYLLEIGMLWLEEHDPDGYKTLKAIICKDDDFYEETMNDAHEVNQTSQRYYNRLSHLNQFFALKTANEFKQAMGLREQQPGETKVDYFFALGMELSLPNENRPGI